MPNSEPLSLSSNHSDTLALSRIVFRSTSSTIVSLPKHPSFASVPIPTIQTRHRIDNFFQVLHRFLQAVRPNLTMQLSELKQFPIFYKADLAIDPVMDPYTHHIFDHLHACPPKSQIINREDPSFGRFDTVLVCKHPEKGLEFGMSSKYSSNCSSKSAVHFSE
jgi:hypothetical protein